VLDDALERLFRCPYIHVLSADMDRIFTRNRSITWRVFVNAGRHLVGLDFDIAVIDNSRERNGERHVIIYADQTFLKLG
jgi:hypothetical protein